MEEFTCASNVTKIEVNNVINLSTKSIKQCLKRKKKKRLRKKSINK